MKRKFSYLIRELHRNVGSFKRPASSNYSEDEIDGDSTLPLISTNAETGRINLPQDKIPVSKGHTLTVYINFCVHFSLILSNYEVYF